MAVALTLAVNIAQRLRKEELEKEKQEAIQAAREAEEAEREERKRKMQAEHEERMFAESLAAQIVEHQHPVPPVIATPIAVVDVADSDVEPVEVVAVEEEPELPASALDGIEPEPCTDVVEPTEELVVLEPTPQMELDFTAPLPEPVADVVVEEPAEPFVQAEDPPTLPPAVDLPPPNQRHQRPYPGIWTVDGSVGKIDELVAHLQWLKTRQNSGEPLSKDDQWELRAIEDILSKHGYSMYL